MKFALYKGERVEAEATLHLLPNTELRKYIT